MKRLAISLLPILLLITSSSHGLRVYKWSDSKGVHYSDRRPPPMAEDPAQVRINSDARRKTRKQRRIQRWLAYQKTLATVSDESGNAPASESGFGELTVGAVGTGNTSSSSSVGGGQSTTDGGQVATNETPTTTNNESSAPERQEEPSSTEDQKELNPPAPPESDSEGAGSTSEPVEVATIETPTTTNNESSAPEPQNEPEPVEVAQVETIEVSGSGAISSPKSAPSTGGSLAGDPKYFNSSERGCDGTDSTVLFCDDFEDGNWADTNCRNNGENNPGNDGWCMFIFTDFNDPKGTGWGRCGGLGVAGTNCAVTSGEIPPSPGGNTMGQHNFVNESEYDEVYVRYYVKQLPGFVMGHEKMLYFINDKSGYNCCLLHKYWGSGKLNFVNKFVDQGWFPQNQGNDITLQNNKWFYIEIHLKLDNPPGAGNGVYELWADDCGQDGLGCTGPGTLRARHTNGRFRNSSNELIGTAWLENWGNRSSTGEQYYDQIYVATRRIGPM